jgi:hypothetical protein
VSRARLFETVLVFKSPAYVVLDASGHVAFAVATLFFTGEIYGAPDPAGHARRRSPP